MPNETGFCNAATTLKVRLITILRSPRQQRTELDGDGREAPDEIQ
jgi:hypothetical protein